VTWGVSVAPHGMAGGATWPLRKLRLREAVRDCRRRGSGAEAVGNGGSGSKAKVSRSALEKRGDLQGGAPEIAKLVQITLITMVYGRYIYTYYGL